MATVQPSPLPADFRLKFSRDLRAPIPNVLIGGAPLRVLRLTPAGASRVDKWQAGAPVGAGKAAGVLAARLVESGLAVAVPPSIAATMRVTIVIPVRDDQNGLDATLGALPSAAEVFVVDDGSSPAMVAPGSHVIRRSASGGPAAARNTGWHAATGADLIAFVDAGCVPDPGWLDVLTPYFADPAMAAAAPRIHVTIDHRTPPPLARYEKKRSPLDMGPAPAVVSPGGAVSYVPSTALIARRSDLVAVGGFDETMRFGEDVDLVWRLRAAGRRVAYVPSAGATHPARATWGHWLQQRYSYGTSAAGLAARHGRAVAPVAVSPWSTAVWGLVVGGHPMAGAILTVGSAVALAKRGGDDSAVRKELARLAVVGTLKSGAWLAGAIRRAWLPPAIIAAVALRPSRRLAAAAFAVAVAPDLKRGTLGIGLADDLAYQAGLWTGVIRQRSFAALMPRW